MKFATRWLSHLVELRLARERAQVTPSGTWPARAALAVGLAYAGVSGYWGLGGTGLLDTVGSSLAAAGLVWTAVGLLVQSGLIRAGAGADHRARAWHAFRWAPWFLVGGLLVTGARLSGGRPDAAFPPADAAGR